MGPPGGFHGTIRPQEQGKVKAERNDDGIHQEQERAPGKHFRRLFFSFFHK
jgi:hypothetical protein